MSSSGGGYSGTSYDRWSYEHSARDPNAHETTLNKIQHKYWIAKTAVQRKLGKDEDENIVASDSELDAKLTLFKSISDTTINLQRLIENYQDRLCNLSYEENCLGRFLKDFGKSDKTKAGKMMVAVGKTMSYSGQQRLAIRVPLVRLYQEVETFRQRAIEDTLWTVSNMEKIRTEYRGALNWMKKVSQELDPDTFRQLEKFRKVQSHVKQSKAKFDKLKLDCLQKIDLLAASRCNMFSHALIMYQNTLITFWEKTAKTMTHVNDSFQGYQYYEFSYIKDLAQPSRDLANSTNPKKAAKSKTVEKKEGKEEVDEHYFFEASEFKDNPEQGQEIPPSGQEESLLDIGQGTSMEEDTLLNIGDDEEASSEDVMNLLSAGSLGPMSSRPLTSEDANLLEDLMGGPTDNPSNAFGAQWNEMFGGAREDDFGDFVSPVEQGGAGAPPGGAKSESPSKNFLPSQLFDRNLSLYAKQSASASGGADDLLGDFPMPGPPITSTVEEQLSKAHQKQRKPKNDMSQWFSLFADLDPLANPDAIGKSTKETDPNCYS